MRKALRVTVVLATIAMLLMVFVLSGCTRKPNEEQLQQLDELKAEVQELESSVEDCQDEQAELESELAAKKQTLEDAKEEQEMVSKRLSAME